MLDESQNMTSMLKSFSLKEMTNNEQHVTDKKYKHMKNSIEKHSKTHTPFQASHKNPIQYLLNQFQNQWFLAEKRTNLS